jgi:hypothetical protein
VHGLSAAPEPRRAIRVFPEVGSQRSRIDGCGRGHDEVHRRTLGHRHLGIDRARRAVIAEHHARGILRAVAVRDADAGALQEAEQRVAFRDELTTSVDLCVAVIEAQLARLAAAAAPCFVAWGVEHRAADRFVGRRQQPGRAGHVVFGDATAQLCAELLQPLLRLGCSGRRGLAEPRGERARHQAGAADQPPFDRREHGRQSQPAQREQQHAVEPHREGCRLLAHAPCSRHTASTTK